MSYKANQQLGLMAGFSRLFGGKVLSSFSDDDIDWAFFQVAFSY